MSIPNEEKHARETEMYMRECELKDWMLENHLYEIEI